MLNEKGITVTDLELRMLIEAAVAEFNEAFKQTEVPEYDFDEDCEKKKTGAAEMPALVFFYLNFLIPFKRKYL